MRNSLALSSCALSSTIEDNNVYIIYIAQIYRSCCDVLFLFSQGQTDIIVMAQQHRDWAKLGFIRGIAVSPVMCCSLSTSQWVSLLLRVVKGSLPDGDALPSNVSAAFLPRQVMLKLSK